MAALIELITSAASFIASVAFTWPSAVTTSASGGSVANPAFVASTVASVASAFGIAASVASLKLMAFD